MNLTKNILDDHDYSPDDSGDEYEGTPNPWEQMSQESKNDMERDCN